MDRDVDDEMPTVVLRDDRTMQAFRDMFNDDDLKYSDDGYMFPDEDEPNELRNDIPIGKKLLLNVICQLYFKMYLKFFRYLGEFSFVYARVIISEFSGFSFNELSSQIFSLKKSKRNNSKRIKENNFCTNDLLIKI